jgi:pimeloyl-ACP methyl ester carboxylesterase
MQGPFRHLCPSRSPLPPSASTRKPPHRSRPFKSPARPDFAKRLGKGEHIVTVNSGHNIHLEQPALVVQAIERVIAAAERSAPSINK